MSSQLKAFIGHTFIEYDEPLINKIISFLAKNEVGSITGEKAQNKSVSGKVKDRITSCDFFIGVFTRGEELCGTPKKILWETGYNPSGKFTTSNWVIQECGYALGKDKPVLLMVENGVFKFPELQGDQEIIFFDRSNFDSALLRLLEMLHDIRQNQFKNNSLSPNLSDTQLSTHMESEPKVEESQDIAFKEMFHAIKEKDFEMMDEIYTKKVRITLESDREKQQWDAIILKQKYLGGQRNAIDELTKFAETTSNPLVFGQLAECLQFGKKYEQAIKFHKQSIALSENEKEKSRFAVNIADCYEKIEGVSRAIKYLLEETEVAPTEKIFIALIKFASKLKNDYLFTIFSEKLLIINPVNSAVRFDLAYKYSEIGQENIAIHHYMQYLRITDDASGFNNLGVSFNALDAKIKSIEYYKKAKEGNHTLAMANLANKYIDAGFIDEAQQMISIAESLIKEGKEIHENIGLAKKKLQEHMDEEDKKVKDILFESERLQKYRMDHAEAYCTPSELAKDTIHRQLFGIDKWGDIELSFNFQTGELTGNVKVREEYSDLLTMALLGVRNVNQDKFYKIKEISILGNFKNQAGKYSLKVTEMKEQGDTKADDIFITDGLFIISPTFKSMQILQNEKEKQRILVWTARP